MLTIPIQDSPSRLATMLLLEAHVLPARFLRTKVLTGLLLYIFNMLLRASMNLLNKLEACLRKFFSDISPFSKYGHIPNVAS
jgi:hypothetical protein